MKLVIPAIDVYEGKVVRLTRGDFSQITVYSEDPIGVIEHFRSKGFRRIHVVDLEGAKTGEIRILGLIKKMKERFDDILLQFGGGVRSYEVVERVIEAGADFVIVGTMFVKDPEGFERVVSDFREKVILSLDVNAGKVAVHGWQADSGLSIEEAFEKALRIGVLRIMSTDVTRDGTLLGPDVNLISLLLDTMKRKYFDIVIDEIVGLESVKKAIEEGLALITREVDEFMDILKGPYSGGYEVRRKIEEYDKSLDRYRDSIKDIVPWDEVLRKYPKPLLIVSGGISSDSDIEEIFKLDNSFLEGVIVGKSIYEGRLSILDK
ncbi:MAG: 1-(5-phosphoribosyl)-5-[(5-phosphoribosylamino)methylideneamino] imidazole-4-carboxamide isomerase [Brevinematia bacterium]